MNSAYEILEAQGERFMAIVGAIQTEQPVTEEATREVRSNFSRGGFLRSPRVGLDREAMKASLFICARDTKVKNTCEDEYGYTNIKIANFEDGRGFTRNNAIFEAMLSREQYDACVALGICPAKADLRHKVSMDLRRCRLFPLVDEDINVYHTILAQRQREATCDALKKVRDWALDYLREHDEEFAAAHPKRERGESDPALATVKASYTAFIVTCPDDKTDAVIDFSVYRRDIRGERKAINEAIAAIKAERKAAKDKTYRADEMTTLETQLNGLKEQFGSHCVYHCTVSQFNALDAEYQAAAAAVKVNAARVRLLELGLLESNGLGTLDMEGKRLVLSAEQRVEYFRALPDAIAYWRQFNGYREVVAATPSPEVLAEGNAGAGWR
jgi:hypothetical protein